MPNKEKLRDKVVELAKNYVSNKNKMDDLKQRNAQIKKKIIATLQDIGIKSQMRDNYEAKYSIPRSFDEGLFKYNNPDLSKQFITTKTETITQTIETFNKKLLQENMPALWEKYRTPGTPRLTVKYHVPQEIIDKLIEEA